MFEDDTLEYDTLWDEDFYEVLRQDAEADAADRWITAWDRLEALGVVTSEDHNMTLAQLERIAGMLG